MSASGALVDLGALSRPATVLVEKVCNAVGMIYEPLHIKRLAKAEADAQTTRALAELDLRDELERRGLRRFLSGEARKQQNIESITAQAVAALPAAAQVDGLEEDWIAHFFGHCAHVSDGEMQSLWGRILLGEATNPGAFSRRTVSFVSTLDKKDAEMFTTFCQFVWILGGPTPLIYENHHAIYETKGIDLDALKHLDAIGLISFESLTGFARTFKTSRPSVTYRDKIVTVSVLGEDQGVPIGQAMLTRVGRELFPICGAVRNDEFFDFVVDRWRQQGMAPEVE